MAANVIPIGTAKQEPAGRCVKCGEVVPLARTFQADNGTGALLHHAAGKDCGPVAKALLFHVVAHVGPMLMRVKLPSLYLPEERYDEVLGQWDAMLQATIQARDQKGAILIGAAVPQVVITSWARVGVLL